MFGGTILVGMASFIACSSSTGGEGGDGDSGGSGSGMCTTDTSSDTQNCGSCGHACLAGEACVGGSCRLSCTPPQVQCGTTCADTSSNSLNCGACGTMCTTGQICTNSACVMGECAAGTMLCAGACVNTQADLRNCGSCGNICLAGQSCTAGTCTGGGGTGGTGGVGTGGASGASGAGMTGGASGAGMTGGSAGMTGGSAGTGGTTGECRVWMAPNGNDSNPGTEASPVLTLSHGYDLVCPMQQNVENGTECAGPAPRTLCIKSGTYNVATRFEFRKTRMGTASNRIIVQGAPGVTLAQRPVFNFSSQPRLDCNENPDDGNRGAITINAHYVTLKNLVVRGANDSGIEVQGIEGIIENVLTYENADTGIIISSGDPFTPQARNNVVRNCDSHTNNDSQCMGENADGFAIKEGTGTGNQFIGCRAWNNADDGFDFFAWTSPVRLENSWAFDQTRTTGGSGSDGNGFKLGGDDVSAVHVLSALFATGNTRGSNGEGFLRNSNPASMSCSNSCASWGNTVNTADGISGVSSTAPAGATVAKMTADAARNADGSLKPITGL